jgi:hypothetical protein
MTTAKKGGTNGAVAASPERLHVRVALSSLTIGEIAAAEALAGVSMDWATAPDKPRGLIYQGIACVVQQRTNPEFTWDDAADVIVELEEPKPVPPTNGRGSSTGSRSRNTSRSSAGRTSKP